MSNAPIVLILGDTPEARALAEAVAKTGTRGIYAHAGRRTSREPPPLPTRIGGFGGADGLARYLLEAGITHIVDATQPFTRTMSENAMAAAAEVGVPLVAYSRPAWTAEPDDTWITAPTMASVVAALDTDPQRIFLAIGRQDVARFSRCPQHHYLLRLATPARSAPPLPKHDVIVARGPFDVAAETAFLRERKIGLIVTRNTGTPQAAAKLQAARELGVPVLMVDRPRFEGREEVHALEDVLTWLGQPTE